MKFFKAKFLILAVLFLLPLVASCKTTPANTDDSDKNNNSTATTDSNDGENVDIAETTEYIYPEDMDGGGEEFNIFTPTTTWFFYTSIVHDEMTGDVLDDAIYMRNRIIEDKFNINLKETNSDIESFNAQLRKTVKAGDDSYDAAFSPMFRGATFSTMISENIFYNLREIPTMNLDEKWWNQMINTGASLAGGEKLFFGGCDINIMTLQCLECVFFNQDMMTNLGLDLPYNKVREGTWTFDEFNKYCKAGAQLNGADSFKWDAGANSVYGFISYDNSVNALLDGSGEQYVTVETDGTLKLAVEGERFVNVLTKIQEMLVVQDGTYLFANTAPDFHYEPLFQNGRALMTMGEIKAADVFKAMETTFGIVPIPKYNEIQEDYYCHNIFATPLTVIPSSNARPDFAGAVLDAMAYLSNKDVTPVFFDKTVSQKRLRNDDSIEMLEIIKDSSCIDIGLVYGISSDFYEAIRHSLGEGKSFDIASQTEKHKEKMNINIDKLMDILN